MDKKIFLHAKTGDRNLLGLGRDSWVAGELSQIDNALVSGDLSRINGRTEVGMLDPRLFGLPLRSLTNVYWEKESKLNVDSLTRKYGVATGITALPVKQMTLSLSTGYEHRRNYDKSGAFPAAARDLIVTTPSFSWDRRDSFTRPRRGAFFSSSVDLSKSIGTTLDNFIKVKLEARYFISPLERFTFAGVVRGGFLQPYGGAGSVPEDQLFYLGGTGDVRGFGENLFHWRDSGVAVGADVSLSATIEARVVLGANFELALFTDAGRLENDIKSIAPDQFRSSAGGGVRYITPIGPIGILYGRKLKRLPGEDPGAFHFSFGYTF